MAANGISTLTITTGITLNSFNGGAASSYVVADGTFNYDAYGVGSVAILQDFSGPVDVYVSQNFIGGSNPFVSQRNWTFVPGNGQPSFSRQMGPLTQGTADSDDDRPIWILTTADSQPFAGTGAGQLNSSLIPDGTSFVMYLTVLGAGGGADKEARQLAKLDLAAINRAAVGNPRATYDITQLPTQYDGNAVVDNPNVGGLIVGRPWTEE